MTAPNAQRMAALEASHWELVKAAKRAYAYFERNGDTGLGPALALENALANARALHQPGQGESEE